ncbi:GDYXXLXY domain-containing protein [Bryobacter aggregatus]|uniref:GDYXXLXY domain-containing protein n=1 Tax=Bryobacter aggregatus TaxID=360054 RepID=UPI0004E23535|nr:GDYXXLXY domain-containing protein [Bryobacter aggregatus]
MRKSFLVGLIQAGIVLSVWVNYAWQQRTLPRAWVRTAPYDPYDLMRGRYVSLTLTPEADEATRAVQNADPQGELFVEGGRLHIRTADCCVRFTPRGARTLNGFVRIIEPVRFHIPENIPDPSRQQDGDELWAEVVVPKAGAPRPTQLAVKKKDGSWVPLRLER